MSVSLGYKVLKKKKKENMETPDGEIDDSHLPATKGELRAVIARMDAMVLEMKSNRTGVQQSGPTIPAADTVVEEESRFSYLSQAFLRHKGCRAKIVIYHFRNSKKHL